MRLLELENYIQQTLETSRFRDYCPNGLQVSGRSEVKSLISGVTANLELIEAAIEAKADAILVHHGWFWKNEDPRIVGIKHRRLALLLKHEISLLAYHLPLDAHPVLGNNAQLAMRLGLTLDSNYGEQSLGALGQADQELPLSAWGGLLVQKLGHVPLLIGDPNKTISRVAWCTGAAQSYFSEAIDLGVDVFITGEISEPMVHLSRESGVAFIAAGHHATERYGVETLGNHLAENFGLVHRFVDVPSPV